MHYLGSLSESVSAKLSYPRLGQASVTTSQLRISLQVWLLFFPVRTRNQATLTLPALPCYHFSNGLRCRRHITSDRDEVFIFQLPTIIQRRLMNLCASTSHKSLVPCLLNMAFQSCSGWWKILCLSVGFLEKIPSNLS